MTQSNFELRIVSFSQKKIVRQNTLSVLFRTFTKKNTTNTCLNKKYNILLMPYLWHNKFIVKFI